MKYTVITCSSRPRVTKNGSLRAVVSPVLAKEPELYLAKLEVGSRGWLVILGDQRDISIFSSPGNQFPRRTR